MPSLSIAFYYSSKPVVELYVTMGSTELEVRKESGPVVPVSLKILALVDTGAGMSQVDLSTLRHLEVSVVNEVDVYTASTGDQAERRGVYVVDLDFAGDLLGSLAKDLKVIGSDSLAGLKVQMLLGRDVLDRCLLAYDGLNRRFSLAYDAPPG